MLGRRNEDAFAHQARRRSSRARRFCTSDLNFEIIEIRSAENDSRIGRCRYESRWLRTACVKTNPVDFDWPLNCDLVRHSERAPFYKAFLPPRHRNFQRVFLMAYPAFSNAAPSACGRHTTHRPMLLCRFETFDRPESEKSATQTCSPPLLRRMGRTSNRLPRPSHNGSHRSAPERRPYLARHEARRSAGKQKAGVARTLQAPEARL